MTSHEALTLAHETLSQILQMTLALQLTGQKDKEEEEAESYAALMETRAPLINKLTELKPMIDTTTPGFAELTRIIRDIMQLDKKQLDFMEHLRKNVQDSLKEVKSGQKINTAYNAFEESGRGHFDTSQ